MAGCMPLAFTQEDFLVQIFTMYTSKLASKSSLKNNFMNVVPVYFFLSVVIFRLFFHSVS